MTIIYRQTDRHTYLTQILQKIILQSEGDKMSLLCNCYCESHLYCINSFNLITAYVNEKKI